VSKNVVIVESPAKARTIGKFLGKGYRVESCMGHVRDLPEKAFGVDIEEGFRPRYLVLPKRRQVLANLARAVKGAETVYLAPDPDREGESIAWHLAEALKLPKNRVRRVTFNEITRRGVRTGFSAPREIDMNLVNAQQARRILDRIVGYQLSPLLWRKVLRGLSAGRVQSVALRLLVEREKAIQAFEPEEYWKLAARLVPAGEEGAATEFRAELVELDGEKVRIPNGDEARALVERLAGEAFAVGSVVTERKRTRPLPPFATSQLQQAASVRLGFRPKRTMALAQQLYEGIEVGDEGLVGLITYMRTDSFRIADEALDQCRSFVRRQMGEKYLSAKPRRFRSRRGAQEAHEAIRPTSVERTPEALEPHLAPAQLKLYRLIWQRFVASQMAEAEYDVTRVSIGAGPAEFRATGRVLIFDGHTRVYQPLRKRDEEERQPLPPLREGQALRCLELLPTQHFTKPPPRYTEASLVKTLEREGIGRPSTYAQIISTIQERGYAEVRDKVFYVKELGIVTNDVLLPFFENIINTKFTSQLENHLDSIEEGKRDWRDVLREFYEPFRADLEKAQAEMTSVKEKLAKPTGIACPRCGAEMVVRMSKRGRFMACSAFPNCRYTQPLGEEGKPAPVKTLDEKCPECGQPLVVRTGRRGKFAGCSNYPKCRYTRNLTAEEAGTPTPEAAHPGAAQPGSAEPVAGEPQQAETPQEAPAPPTRQALEPTGEKCPECGQPLVVREGRRGKFIGCSGFPKCRYTRDAEPGEGGPAESEAGPAPVRQEPEPTGEKCPKCGKPLVVRTGRRGKFIGCSAFPKCRFTRNVEGAGPAAPEATDVKCDKCGAAMVVRRSNRGRFLACSAYPKCRNTKPLKEVGPPPPPQKVGRTCPECGKALVLRHGPRGSFVGCSGYPECRYTQRASEAPEDGDSQGGGTE